MESCGWHHDTCFGEGDGGGKMRFGEIAASVVAVVIDGGVVVDVVDAVDVVDVVDDVAVDDGDEGMM